MRKATLRFPALVIAVFLMGSAAPGQAQGAFAHGTIVGLQGTPHLWFADEHGVLHWGGDTRALAGKHIDWSNRVEVSLERLRTLPVGDPWLTAGLLKDGDPIYLVKWETEWELPQLLHIQSIKDVELLGINGSNYGNFVIEKNEWERRFGISAAGLQRSVLAAAVTGSAPTSVLQPAPTPTATPEPDTGAWKLQTGRDNEALGQQIDLSLRSTTYKSAYSAETAYNESASLHIQCTDGRLWGDSVKAFISWWPERFTGVRVQAGMRFGSEDVIHNANWKLEEFRHHTVIPTIYQADFDFAFIPKLQESSRFEASVTKRDGSTITATWDTSGLTAALQPLWERCPAQVAGNWKLFNIEPIGGSSGRIELVLQNSIRKAGIYAGSPPPGGNLHIVCSNRGNYRPGLTTHIAWDTRFSGERLVWGRERVRGSVRFGSENAINVEWELFDKGQTTIIPPEDLKNLDFSFVDKLQQSNRFQVRVERPNDTAITATWDTTGLAAALVPLRERCPGMSASATGNWELGTENVQRSYQAKAMGWFALDNV